MTFDGFLPWVSSEQWTWQPDIAESGDKQTRNKDFSLCHHTSLSSLTRSKYDQGTVAYTTIYKQVIGSSQKVEDVSKIYL